MGKDNIWIRCPKFGGERVPHACIAQDKYRICRRACKTLEEVIGKKAEIVDEALKRFKKSRRTRFAGVGLPNSLLTCKVCRFLAETDLGLKKHALSHGRTRTCEVCEFVAKSVMGLKQHMSKSHGWGA